MAMERPVVVNYGGGTNSTALLIEATTRGLRVDQIVFADTGSERPETYTFLGTFNDWLQQHGMPKIDILRWIRKDGTFQALDDWCLANNTLPSKAFGYSGCTAKWKQQPIDKALREQWANRFPVERWIGYDYDEPRRAQRMLEKNPEPDKWIWRCPLVEWEMGRAECVASIEAAGLELPNKSSCYMCPSMRKPEIIQLRLTHPSLADRSLEMEQRWRATTRPDDSSIQGLGRNFAWSDVLAEKACGVEVVDQDCGCFDGDE